MPQPLIERFRPYLPVSESTPIVSLQEGSTPLIEVPKIAGRISPNVRVFVKFEGANPTGSFKDRGMTVAVSKAMEEGSKAVICASTGNTSASAAAYAARAGLRCFVLLPQGKVAAGKLAQTLMHGAEVIALEGNFDQAMSIVLDLAESYPITVVNSTNPFRTEGQKTAAFEIIEELGDAPDYHAIPVGNARNIVSYWRGYKEFHERGKATKLPKMVGFQAEGSAPLVLGHPIENPETVATAIRIGNPVSFDEAIAARDESGGLIRAVSDDQILAAQFLLATKEGIFVEPASAAPIAGLLVLGQDGFFSEPATITVTCTGHGLKDPDIAITQAKPPITVPADRSAVAAALGFSG
jgi:threonine synthase